MDYDYRRKYREKNKEKISEYMKRYRKENRDKLNEYKRERYKKKRVSGYIEDRPKARRYIYIIKGDTIKEFLGYKEASEKLHTGAYNLRYAYLKCNGYSYSLDAYVIVSKEKLTHNEIMYIHNERLK